jgi:hypothetical protein
MSGPFNKKSLAAKLKISVNTLNKHIEIFLSDPAIKKEFGTYRFKRFTDKQIEIFERETGFSITS